MLCLAQSNSLFAQVPDRELADIFYAAALGLVRDPALKGHPKVTWYNIGRQQVLIPLSTLHVKPCAISKDLLLHIMKYKTAASLQHTVQLDARSALHHTSAVLPSFPASSNQLSQTALRLCCLAAVCSISLGMIKELCYLNFV